MNNVKNLLPALVFGSILLLKSAILLYEAGLLMGLSLFCHIRLWSAYLSMVLLLLIPVLLCKRYRWTYVLSLLLDVWLIGNLIYFRSFGDFLSHWLLGSVRSMDGFWSSILLYIRPMDILMVVLTVVWILFREWYGRRVEQSCTILGAVTAWVCACLLYVPSLITNIRMEQGLLPFSSYYAEVSMGRIWYVETYGPYTHLLNEALALMRPEPPAQPISDEEIAPYIQKGAVDSVQTMEANLLMILVESMEYWTLTDYDARLTPCLSALKCNPYTRILKVRPQVAAGKSSDARLMLLCGILPLRDGAFSVRYSTNSYPSIVHYSHAKTKQMLAASPASAWNQGAMAAVWGFHSIYAEEVTDSILVDTTLRVIRDANRPFLLLQTTMASHAPFLVHDDYPDYPDIAWVDEEHHRYSRCIGYTDRQLGREIDAILQDSVLSRTTRILVMGDHSIFSEKEWVPLLWYDPLMEPNSVEDDVLLEQVEVYRFLRAHSGIATPWLGVNADDADLSDRYIRTNYKLHE